MDGTAHKNGFIPRVNASELGRMFEILQEQIEAVPRAPDPVVDPIAVCEEMSARHGIRDHRRLACLFRRAVALRCMIEDPEVWDAIVSYPEAANTPHYAAVPYPAIECAAALAANTEMAGELATNSFDPDAFIGGLKHLADDDDESNYFGLPEDDEAAAGMESFTIAEDTESEEDEPLRIEHIFLQVTSGQSAHAKRIAVLGELVKIAARQSRKSQAAILAAIAIVLQGGGVA